MNKTLTLKTDYKRFGNATGQQIDTLARALGHWTSEELQDNNFEFLDQAEEAAYNDFDYEAAYIESLAEAKNIAPHIDALIADKKLYLKLLGEFTEKLKEKARDGSLEESHQLMKDVQEARDRYYEDLYKEWLHGDRSSRGILGDAERRYNVAFSYDTKDDCLTVDISKDRIADMKESGDIDRKTIAAACEYLVAAIENDALKEWNKSQEKADANREERERVKAYRRKLEVEEEVERVAKLKAIR